MSGREVLKLGLVLVSNKEVAALGGLTKCPLETHLTRNIFSIGLRLFKSESILMQMLELYILFYSHHTLSPAP